MTANDKLVQYLQEAHALEAALVQTLTVHIAMTPEGEYRDLLENHLQETRDQTAAIEQRLRDLGAGRNPFTLGLGIIETVIGQAVAFGKAPLDLMRGTGGDEKLVKNAKDEVASEALEIATYDTVEALADAVGDATTADLARRHREQEERALNRLRELIPGLTQAFVAADVVGVESYDAARTGAADTVRAAAREVREKAAQTAGEARDAAAGAGARARRTAARATPSGSSSRSRSSSASRRDTPSGSGSRGRASTSARDTPSGSRPRGRASTSSPAGGDSPRSGGSSRTRRSPKNGPSSGDGS